MNNATLLDSNILIYAFVQNPNFPEQKQSHLKCKMILENEQNLYINYNCYLEFRRVMTSKSMLQFVDLDFVQQAQLYLEKKAKILYPTEMSNSILKNLLQTYPAKSGQIFDLLLLAQAIEKDISTIYTKNTKDFPSDEGIQIIDPSI